MPAACKAAGYGRNTCYIKPKIDGVRPIQWTFKADVAKLHSLFGGESDQCMHLFTRDGGHYGLNGAMVRKGDAIKIAHIALQCIKEDGPEQIRNVLAMLDAME